MGLITDYKNYFASKAQSHKQIGNGSSEHFVLTSFDAFEKLKRNNLEWPVMVLEPPDISVNGPDESQILQKYVGACGVYLQCSDRNTSIAEAEVLIDESLTIIEDILAKMREDAQQAPPHPLLSHFNVRESTMLLIEKPDFIGYRLEFEFSYAKDYEVNTNQWL